MQELKQLAVEIRSELSSIVSKTDKSLKSSLAAVELTVALHHVFHAPVDKILWDVGEQVSNSSTKEGNLIGSYTNLLSFVGRHMHIKFLLEDGLSFIH